MEPAHVAYFIILYVVSLAFGYELRFTEATLHFGRSISKIQEGKGVQDAITPPYSTNLAIVAYVAAVLVLGFGFYLFGIWLGLGVVALFYFVVMINRVLLIPKPESPHFRHLILMSMMNRYADYVKGGDQLRANMMAALLESAGVPINDLVAKLQKRGTT